MWYHGITKQDVSRYFKSSIRPTRSRYGGKFKLIYGPFKSESSARGHKHNPIPVDTYIESRIARRRRLERELHEVEIDPEILEELPVDPSIRIMSQGEVREKLLKRLLKKNKYAGIRRRNPPVGAVEIYDTIEAIEASKSINSNFPLDKFRHDFKGSTGAKVFGLKDGSLLIKGKKRLWKTIKYEEDELP